MNRSKWMVGTIWELLCNQREKKERIDTYPRKEKDKRGRREIKSNSGESTWKIRTTMIAGKNE